VEFLVEFEVNIPDGTPESQVQHREKAEAAAAAKLVDEGHLVRLWKRSVATGETKILGLYRADSETELDALLGALPLYEWMYITITPLGRHPNDPGGEPNDRLSGSRPAAVRPAGRLTASPPHPPTDRSQS